MSKILFLKLGSFFSDPLTVTKRGYKLSYILPFSFGDLDRVEVATGIFFWIATRVRSRPKLNDRVEHFWVATYGSMVPNTTPIFLWNRNDFGQKAKNICQKNNFKFSKDWNIHVTLISTLWFFHVVFLNKPPFFVYLKT